MEERQPGKVFKPLMRHDRAVTSGCPSAVLCGLGQVTQGLCTLHPSPVRTMTPPSSLAELS